MSKERELYEVVCTHADLPPEEVENTSITWRGKARTPNEAKKLANNYLSKRVEFALQIVKVAPVRFTKTEIILETAGFYNLGNRSLSPAGGCAYRGIGDKTCAFARCMLPKKLDEYADCSKFVTSLDKDPDGSVDSLLQGVYRGHSVDFWADIQELHDSTHYWNETGLNAVGEDRKRFFIKKWKHLDSPRYPDTIAP